MKKLALVVLSLAFLSFAACTGQESSQTPESQTSQSSPVEEEAGTEDQGTGFVSLPEDTGTLAPENVLKNALRLTQPEVESALGVTLSEDSVKPNADATSGGVRRRAVVRTWSGARVPVSAGRDAKPGP